MSWRCPQGLSGSSPHPQPSPARCPCRPEAEALGHETSGSRGSVRPDGCRGPVCRPDGPRRRIGPGRTSGADCSGRGSREDHAARYGAGPPPASRRAGALPGRCLLTLGSFAGSTSPRTSGRHGHRGVDLSAVVGQPVLSAGEGVVAFSGVIAGRGVSSVRHAGGLRTTYDPVDRRLASGVVVGKGDRIGVVAPGPGHCAPLTCLHWGAISPRQPGINAPTTIPCRSWAPCRPILLPLG